MRIQDAQILNAIHDALAELDEHIRTRARTPDIVVTLEGNKVPEFVALEPQFFRIIDTILQYPYWHTHMQELKLLAEYRHNLDWKAVYKKVELGLPTSPHADRLDPDRKYLPR
ncbi:hypothetical protein MMC07_009620 [Pseudocyphellaria aurata]|nr:hypothetical protein [Pseudocyphellaria aurata]